MNNSPRLIPDNILEDILSRTDIVELISSYIPLKHSGRNFKACCPFHHEKTASFTVSTDKQIYHCFGCGVGGNAFNFLMQYERMEFLEAVETLAQKTQIALPKKTDQASGNPNSVTSMIYKINEASGVFYESVLNSPAGAAAKQYLLNRGLKPETIKLFKLGFATDKWDSLISHLRAKNINLGLLEKAGMVLKKDEGGYYDRFRNRIIFPVHDVKSRTIAFGARVLDKSLPKYLNSPETAVYVKGKNLYGLNLAKDAIRDNDCVAIVEGYLDFIMPFQEGFQNIVASLGTALTIDQIRTLKRYTSNIVMIYDPDTAGQIATLRSLDLLIDEGLNVSVVSLPQGLDPDTFVRKEGIEEFKNRVKQAENLIDYKLKIMKTRYSCKDAQGKARICAELLPTINKFKNDILKSEYIKKLSQELEVDEDALIKELNKFSPEKKYDLASKQPQRPIEASPTEKLLVKLMLEESELVNRIKDRIMPEDFQDKRMSKIVSTMFELISHGEEVEINRVISSLDDTESSRIICESMFLPTIAADTKEKIVDECIHRLKHKKATLRKEHLHNQIKSAQAAGDAQLLQKLTQDFHCLIKGEN